MLGWDRCRFDKKHAETCYAELVFRYQVGSVGDVHSGTSWVRNIDLPFFMIGWADAVSIESTPGHITPNMCFCIR
jgi:hypothetical protein